MRIRQHETRTYMRTYPHPPTHNTPPHPHTQTPHTLTHFVYCPELRRRACNRLPPLITPLFFGGRAWIRDRLLARCCRRVATCLVPAATCRVAPLRLTICEDQIELALWEPAKGVIVCVCVCVCACVCVCVCLCVYLSVTYLSLHQKK